MKMDFKNQIDTKDYNSYGTKVEFSEKTSFPQGDSFCDCCGAVVHKGERFCTACGVELGKEAEDNQNGVKMGSSGRMILFAVLLLAALAVGVFIGVSLNDKDDGQQASSSQSVISETQEITTKAPVTENQVVTEASTLPDSTTASEVVSFPIEREKMYSDDYIFPSDTELLTSDVLDRFDYYEMDYVTNEIYARHGYIFKMEKFAVYFESKSWYNGTVESMSEAESMFSETERRNINIIVEYERNKGWRD